MIARLSAIAATARVAATTVVLLLLAGCAAPLPPRADVPHGRGLLWQVDKPGYATSYVFGTYHVRDFKVRIAPHVVTDALLRADQAAFEISEDAAEPARQKKLNSRAGILPRPQTLETLLDAESYQRFIAIAEDVLADGPKLGEIHINRFKPWFVMEVLGNGTEGPRVANALARTLDDTLEETAREAGKKVVGLETPEEHIAVFNDMTMDDQLGLMKDWLATYDKGESYWTSRKIYLEGDTAMFYALWQQELARLEPGLAARYAERLIDGRNRLMVERMLPLMQIASTFVGVGCLHLPGEEGILRLLEREGFTVTRLH